MTTMQHTHLTNGRDSKETSIKLIIVADYVIDKQEWKDTQEYDQE